MITPEMIMQVRYEVQDTDITLPFLSDAEYEYILTKNTENIARSSIEAARMILMQLSLRGNSETVDIFSVDNSKSAKNYKESLMLFIKDPNLNPLYKTLSGYVGGVSKSDMEVNDFNVDNNTVPNPSKDRNLGINPLGTLSFTF